MQDQDNFVDLKDRPDLLDNAAHCLFDISPGTFQGEPNRARRAVAQSLTADDLPTIFLALNDQPKGDGRPAGGAFSALIALAAVDHPGVAPLGPWFADWYIAPCMRRRKVGKQLAVFGARYLQTLGYAEAFTWVRRKDVRFYSALNWERIDVPSVKPPDGFDNLFRSDLDAAIDGFETVFGLRSNRKQAVERLPAMATPA